MTPRLTTADLKADFEKKLYILEGKVDKNDYEAKSALKGLHNDFKQMQAERDSYATKEAIANIDKRVDKTSKNQERLAWIVITAVVVAVMSLVIRQPQ